MSEGTDDRPALTGRQIAVARLGKAVARASAGEIWRAAEFLEAAWEVRNGKRTQRAQARARQGR